MLDELEVSISYLEEQVHGLELDYTTKKAIRDKIIQDIHKIQKKTNDLEKKIDTLEQVRILLQRVSEYAREQVKQQIEMLVTHCLQFVFGPNIEFKIELTEARGKASAEFFVISTYDDCKVKTKPQDARGGGVVDVISLALRIAVIQSITYYKEGPLILDEPAKHVSNEYIVNVAQLLKQISKAFQRQIIMVTHDHFLSEIADLAYVVQLKDGISEVSVYDT